MYVNAGVRAGRGPPMLRNRRFAQPAKTPFSARLLREATPVLQSWCCRERRCRGFSIRPETKEGPFVLKCADRLEGEGGNGRTNRCGPHRWFVSMAKRRGSRRRIRCVKRGARFGERFEGRRSEPGVFFSYRTGMKVRNGCGRRKGASLWVGLKRGGASFGDCAQWRRVTARCCLKTS